MLKKAAKYWNLTKVLGYHFVKFFTILLIIFLTVTYYQTKIYDFGTESSTFKEIIYNPYQDWKSSNTIKSNLHAHAQSWGGLTNGADSDVNIQKAYKKLGYGVAAISNYHSILRKKNNDFVEMPTFEHGFNTSKAHFLCINAHKCDYLDFPIFQNLSQKQQRLNNIAQKASLIALAHPGLMNGFSREDLKNLNGYHLLEVMSPYGDHFDLWDYALSHGNASWLIANDDTHGLTKQPAGSFFTVISTEKREKNEIIKALQKGNHVAYKSKEGKTDVFLDSIKTDGQFLYYAFNGNIQKVFMIAEGHKIPINRTGKIPISNIKTYLRFEIEGKQSSLFTNPVLLQSGSFPYKLQSSKSSENLLRTISYRFVVLILSFTALFFILNKEIRTLHHKKSLRFRKKPSQQIFKNI